MSTPILKSIAKFLDRGLDSVKDEKLNVAYFICANDLLKELIASQETSPEDMIEVNLDDIPDLKLNKENKPVVPKVKKWAIIVDKQGKLVEIEGLAPFADVELDGVKMKYAEAIGKKFKSGKVIEK